MTNEREQLKMIRGRIDASLSQADQGRCVDGEAFLQGLVDSVIDEDPGRGSGFGGMNPAAG